MNRFFKLLLIFLCVSAMPLVLTILLWCLTLGSFELINTIHHGMFMFITAIMMFMGFVACCIECDDM
jgi:hypothetical protein